jgi:hypothetical protein
MEIEMKYSFKLSTLVGALALSTVALGLTSCDNDANIVSHNISRDADNFKVMRRIVFYNGITGDYILTIEGFCSLGNKDPEKKLTVTCKMSDLEYKKHFLGLSDNVTFFAEHLDASKVSPNHYKVVFKPSVIIPDIEVR